MISPLLSQGGVSFYREPPTFPPGGNRAGADSVLSADDDWGVVLEFLREFRDRPQTFRSYHKEIEKFLLWLVHIQFVSLSAFRRGDWLDYCDFVEKPPASWVCGKGIKKWRPNGDANPDWRPFVTNTPSARTVSLSREVVKTFFSWLVDSGYLDANPCSARIKRRATSSFDQASIMERILPPHLLEHVFRSCDEALGLASEHDQFNWARIRFVIRFYAGTGIRLSEGLGHWNGRHHVMHRMGDIKPTPTRTRWFFHLVGKGGKFRRVELFDDALSALRDFRLFLGLPALPSVDEKTPLIPRIDLEGTINASSLDTLFKRGFAYAASTLPELIDSPPYSGNRDILNHDLSALKAASAHWLRHSHTTAFLKQTGGDLKATMQRLGHADVNTTMQYLHVLEVMD